MLKVAVGCDLPKTRTLTIAVVLTMVMPALIVSVGSAQSNHNLRWGKEVGDEITYILQRKIIDPSFAQYFTGYAPFIMRVSEGQKVIANVTYLSPIPTMINASVQMPYSNCTLIRENDSETLTEGFSMVLIPTGDWNFTTEVGNYTGFEGLTLVDNENEWGTVMEGSFQILIFTIMFHMEMRYEKVNGTLNYMRVNVDMSGNDIIDVIFAQWHPGMDTVLQGELQVLTIALAGVAGLIVVVVGYVIWRRHRRGRFEAQMPVSQ